MDVNKFITRWQLVYAQVGMRYLIMATVAFVLFYIVFKKPMLKRKIQAKFPKRKDYSRDFLYSVVSVAIFSVVAVFTFFIIKPYTNMYSNVNDYPLWYFGLSMVWMFFLHDAYFYWSHRFMHHPKIFKYVHLIHHKSTNPSPWTSYAFHPLEAVIEAFIIVVIAFTIPTHYLAITLYMLFQIMYNVYGHLGFEIMPKKFNKHFVGKWMNTSVAHNMHHHYFNDNYGLWTTIWDRMFGTMNPKYDEAYTLATANEIAEKKLV